VRCVALRVGVCVCMWSGSNRRLGNLDTPPRLRRRADVQALRDMSVLRGLLGCWVAGFLRAAAIDSGTHRHRRKMRPPSLFSTVLPYLGRCLMATEQSARTLSEPRHPSIPYISSTAPVVVAAAAARCGAAPRNLPILLRTWLRHSTLVSIGRAIAGGRAGTDAVDGTVLISIFGVG
jgi:hypothetical protein